MAVLFDLAAEVNRSKSADLAGLLKALGGTMGLLQADGRMVKMEVDARDGRLLKMKRKD